MGNPTRTFESWNQLFKDRDFVLLENTIINREQKLNFICNKGHKTTIVGQVFLKGGGCKECAYERSKKRTTLSQEYVSDFFKSNGCVLLSKYENNHTPVKFICVCGKKSFIQFNNFYMGKRCRWCKSNRFKGDKNPSWRYDRENKKNEEKFIKKVRQVLYSCFKRKNYNAKTDTDKLGYNKTELFWRLTSHKNWINIKLYKEKFTIDHIFPIIAFYKIGITDYKIINALDNLQPLSRSNNVKKLNKYDELSFTTWLETKGIKIKESQ